MTGGAHSGKDSVAKILIDDGWTRVAFADPVREMALAIDPLVPIEYSHTVRLSQVVKDRGWESSKKIVEVRRLLQVIGTDAVRDMLGEDTWLDIAFDKIDKADSPVVVTDVRFENEAQALREIGGQICLITRPGAHCERDHRSEILTFEPDFNIDNSGTLEALRDLVIHAVTDILEA
jgi:hypothetical protein